MMLFRLFDIPTNNFSAFILDANILLTTVHSMSDSMTPAFSQMVINDITKLVRGYIVSLTGKSSEGSTLLKQLLQDESRQYHFFKDMKKENSFSRFISGDRGQQQQQPQPQPQPQQPQQQRPI